jgi:hypothetical protein
LFEAATGKSSGAGKKNEDGNMSGKRKFKR